MKKPTKLKPGKIREGNPISRRGGLSTRRPIRRWFVVVDKARAILFEDNESGIKERRSFSNPKGREHIHDQVTDRQGRVNQSVGLGRHAYSPNEEFRDQVALPLIEAVCGFVDDAIHAKFRNEFTVLAENQIIGRLRPRLLEKRAEFIFIDCDLGWMDGKELIARLRQEAA